MVGALVKRLVDVVVAALALCILSPVLLVIAILVRANMGSPILFRHTRPGLEGRPFEMLKFRSMRSETAKDGTVLPDARRLTSLGKALRAASLDELPQLWNVLKGDMSLVGPRPLFMHYLDLYTSEQARRHAVRPGVTGLAQVKGRNALTWEEKFAFDTWYVDNRTLWLDITILLLTVRRVIGREGISASGEATMPQFLGYDEAGRSRLALLRSQARGAGMDVDLASKPNIDRKPR